MLEQIRSLQRGESPPPPIADLIGFTLASVEPGHAVVEFTAEPRHDKGRLVARASSTVMTLRGAQAAGR